LTKEEEKEFQRVLFTKYVYGTTAIEGITILKRKPKDFWFMDWLQRIG
jgi:hypothetical protein